jgi:uncharacterized protein YukE
MTDTDADKYGSDITQYSEAGGYESGSHISQLPFMKRFTGTADGIDNETASSSIIADAAGEVGGPILGLAADATMTLLDPIGAIANAGLTIVLDLVQPLDDLLLMVSGDGGEMQTQIELLDQIGTALDELDEEITSDVDANIFSWEGQAADAASNELGGLAATARALAKDASDIAHLLEWAKILAETIYAIIKAILSELVAWLITWGLAALASSVITAGASVVGFLTSAVIKGSRMILKATRKFGIVQTIFQKLIQILRKIKVADRSTQTLWKALLAKAGAGIAKTAYAQRDGLIDALFGSEEAPHDPPYTPVSAFYDSFAVDIAELRAAASAMDGRVPNAEAISATAGEAGAAEMTWGVTGLFFEQPYTEGCANLAEMVGLLGTAITWNTEQLRGCADAYEQTDQESKSELDALSAEVDA